MFIGPYYERDSSVCEFVSRDLFTSTGEEKLHPMPDMSTWQFRPKREEKGGEMTPQERVDLQLSIDRQMEQAGLAYPTSPIDDFLNKWKLRILAACARARRFIKHAWVVFKYGGQETHNQFQIPTSG